MKRIEHFPYVLNAGKEKDNLSPVCYYMTVDQLVLGVMTLIPDTYPYFEVLYMPAEDEAIKEVILSNCEEEDMLATKYIIKMKIPTRPDLDYFYCGEGKSGAQVFEPYESKAKRYDTLEDASGDAFILQSCHNACGQTYTVEAVRQRV